MELLEKRLEDLHGALIKLLMHLRSLECMLSAVLPFVIYVNQFTLNITFEMFYNFDFVFLKFLNILYYFNAV